MFGERAEREGRQECQPADQEDHQGQQRHEQRSVGGEAVGIERCAILRRQTAGDRQHRQDEAEAPQQHGERDHQVVIGRAGAKAGEGRAVIAGTRRVRIQDLAQPMRARIGDRRSGPRQAHTERSQHQHTHRHH